MVLSVQKIINATSIALHSLAPFPVRTLVGLKAIWKAKTQQQTPNKDFLSQLSHSHLAGGGSVLDTATPLAAELLDSNCDYALSLFFTEAETPHGPNWTDGSLHLDFDSDSADPCGLQVRSEPEHLHQ